MKKKEFSCVTFNLKPASSTVCCIALDSISAKSFICSNLNFLHLIFPSVLCEWERDGGIDVRRKVCVCGMGKDEKTDFMMVENS